MILSNIETYYSNSNINSTLVKAYIKGGINEFVKASTDVYKYELESAALIKGSAVDLYLTAGKEEFDKKYYITELPPVSPKSVLIVKQALDTVVMTPNTFTFDSILDTIIVPIAKENGYRTNIKNEQTYKDWLIRECKPYFNALQAANNRTVLSIEDKLLIDLNVNKFIAAFPHIFNNNNKDIEVFFQYPVYDSLFGIECKGLIDIVVIDKIKKIVHIFDIKTIDKLINFKYSFNKFLYNVQATMYTLLAINHFKEYVVQNLKFLVAGFEDNLPASVFSIDSNLIDITLNGHENYKYMPLKTALNNIKIHMDTDNFELDLKYLRFKNSTKVTIMLNNNNNYFDYDFEVTG